MPVPLEDEITAKGCPGRWKDSPSPLPSPGVPGEGEKAGARDGPPADLQTALSFGRDQLAQRDVGEDVVLRAGLAADAFGGLDAGLEVDSVGAGVAAAAEELAHSVSEAHGVPTFFPAVDGRVRVAGVYHGDAECA